MLGPVAPDGGVLALAELEVEAFDLLERVVAAPEFVGTLAAAGAAVVGAGALKGGSSSKRRTFLRWGGCKEVELEKIGGQAQSIPSEPIPTMAEEPASGNPAGAGDAELAACPALPCQAFLVVDCEPSDHPHPQDEEFVVVEKEDAIQAMAFYIAMCIAELPQAQACTPAQLQQALTQTLAGLKKSKFKQACALGRQVYRWGALTYSAISLYQQPWMVQAVLTAIWYASRTALRLAL